MYVATSKRLVAACLLLASSALRADRPVRDPDLPVADWPTPAYWIPSSSPTPPTTARLGAGASPAAAAVPTAPLPFVAVTPCRLADTRGNGFTGPSGPPSLVVAASRAFPVSGSCGIPASARAVSLNLTVTNTQGPGFLIVFPAGSPQPLTSAVTFSGAQTISNATIVAVGDGGGVAIVAGVSGADLVIDVNGYYAEPSKSVVTVRAEPGDPIGNGAALLAAMAKLTDAGPTKPYLLRLEPGLYDLGSGSLPMRPYVDVEGSGMETTTVTAAGKASLSGGTVLGADHSELRSLSVENRGGPNLDAIAIWNKDASPRLTNLRATAFGIPPGFSFAVFNDNASPSLSHVALTALRGYASSGLVNLNGSGTRVEASTIRSEGPNAFTNGIQNGAGSSLSLVSTEISALANGATGAQGIDNKGSSSVELRDVSILAGGSTSVDLGVVNSFGASVRMTNSVVRVPTSVPSGPSAPAPIQVALENDGAATQTIDRSTLSGATASIRNATSQSVYVATSQLDGPVQGPGTFTCAFTYGGAFTGGSASYAPLGANCQPLP